MAEQNPVTQTPSPTVTPEATVVPTVEPVVPTVEPVVEPTDWSDDVYNKIASKYKNDPKEIAKSLWSQQKEYSKTQKAANDYKTELEKLKSTPQPEAKSLRDLHDSAYRDVLETGKLSEASQEMFKAMGLDGNDLQIMARSYENTIAERMKEAQAYVNTPVKELLAFVQKEGTYSDSELAIIQDAVNNNMYGVLKDVERKYKAQIPTKIEHGTLQTSNVTDGFASYAEYKAARGDSKYYSDQSYKAAVDAKYSRTQMTREFKMEMMMGR